MKQTWLNLPLRYKIAGLISILVMAAILVLTVLTVNRERQYFRQELENQADLLLDTLPLTLENPLYSKDQAALLDIARVVSQNRDVDQVVIYEFTGLVLVDSAQPDLVLSKVVDPVGFRLVNAEPDTVFSQWQDGFYLAGKPIFWGNQVIGAVSVGISTREMEQKIGVLTRYSVILGIVTVIVGVALSFWLAR